MTAEEVKVRGYNLDVKNPHTQDDNSEDPEEVLDKLMAAESEAIVLREQLKVALAEALAR
ncbi:MAG: hypothetical protein OXC91_04830 [Rhodobacteraceae bacterium]|nr:hypothetical protein [Paracoccaceae bacterium]